MKIVETQEGVIVEILVKPKSSCFKILVEGDAIIVFCKEKPTEGKANKEVIKEFSRVFHKRVELISGLSSRQKRLFVREASKNEVERILLHV